MLKAIRVLEAMLDAMLDVMLGMWGAGGNVGSARASMDVNCLAPLGAAWVLGNRVCQAHLSPLSLN